MPFRRFRLRTGLPRMAGAKPRLEAHSREKALVEQVIFHFMV